MPNRTGRTPRPRAVLWALAALLVLLVLASVCLGRYPVALRELPGLIFARLTGGVPPSPQADAVFFNVRLPRILLACAVGCCLAAAGCAYQSVFANPMAAPDILGASSGAGFGAALAILLGLGRQLTTLSAFLFSLATLALVLCIARLARGERLVSIILAGVVASSLAGAGTSWLKLVADPAGTLPEITYWLMGSLAKTRTADLLLALFPMAIGLVPLFLLRWRLNLLTQGDAAAQAMGAHPGRLRLAAILCATLITAASVSVSGLVGWVGLVVPHLMRRLVGNDLRYLLPASMLGGAAFLLLVDDIARSLLPTEIPIGILTAFVGAPFFLWLLARRQKG